MRLLGVCKRYFAMAVCRGLCVGLLALVSGVTLQPASAEDGALSAPRSAIDAVLLIDTSGSMTLTDPLRLRYEGAKLFLKFLTDKDRLAIISFSDTAQVVRPLKQFNPAESDSVANEIGALKTEGQYTDIYEAIKAGSIALGRDSREDAQRVMILLSDGKMEPKPLAGQSAESAQALAEERTQALVRDLLPDLKIKEERVHTLAFSAQADRALLGEIAGATEGLNWFTVSPSDVHKSFADLFLAVKQPQIVPLTSKGFRLDDDVEEATFYVTREEGAKLSLISPRNEEITQETLADYVTWFSGQNFDVVTMREPEPGDWEVRGGVAADGFATVLTNVKLVTEWPSTIRSEDRILLQARLYEADKPIALPDMSGVIKYAFQVSPTDKISEPIIRDVLHDDGEKGDRVANDGIFSGIVQIDDPGEYRLSVIARAPTFQRTQQLPFRVKPRLVTLSIEPPHDEHGGDHHGKDGAEGGQHEVSHSGEGGHGSESGGTEGGEHASGDGTEKDDAGHAAPEGHDKRKTNMVKGHGRYLIKVQLSEETKAFRDVDVKLVVRTADRKKLEIPLRKSSFSPLDYELVAAALPKDGQYLIQAFMAASTKKHQEVEAESKKIVFEKRSEENEPESSVKLVLEQKEEHKPESFPVVPLIIVTIGNVLAYAGGYFGIRRFSSAGGKAVVRDSYQAPRALTDLLSKLEAKAMQTEVDLNDPLFASVRDLDGGELGASPLAEDESAAQAEGSAATVADEGGAPAESQQAPPEEPAAAEPQAEEEKIEGES